MLDRRNFLLSLAGALAVPVFGAPAKRSRKVDLGYGLYGMKAVPVDTALGHCAEIGYRNVELALYPGYGVAPEELSASRRVDLRRRVETLELRLSGLKLRLLPSGGAGAEQANVATLTAAAQLARDLAPDHPPVLIVMPDGKPADWDQLKGALAERLRRWSEAVGALGVTLTIKAHVGFIVDTPERLLWLLREADHPALKAVYDYSHFQLAGLSLDDSLRAIVPHTRFIHVKDTRHTATGHEFVLPGAAGNIDYGHYFSLLRELSYAGPVVVEVSTHVFSKPGYDPIAAAKQAYRALAPYV